MASAISEPPVRPVLIPREDRKLSIFCATFKKPMAHKNQMKTFPVTLSLPTLSTCFCTSSSVSAAAGMAAIAARTISTRNRHRILFPFLILIASYSDKGFERNAPTIDVKMRRHQAFISNKKT